MIYHGERLHCQCTLDCNEINSKHLSLSLSERNNCLQTLTMSTARTKLLNRPKSHPNGESNRQLSTRLTSVGLNRFFVIIIVKVDAASCDLFALGAPSAHLFSSRAGISALSLCNIGQSFAVAAYSPSCVFATRKLMTLLHYSFSMVAPTRAQLCINENKLFCLR